MKPGNIFLKKQNDTGKKSLYKINNIYYEIPGIGYESKIGDWGEAYIKG